MWYPRHYTACGSAVDGVLWEASDRALEEVAGESKDKQGGRSEAPCGLRLGGQSPGCDALVTGVGEPDFLSDFGHVKHAE